MRSDIDFYAPADTKTPRRQVTDDQLGSSSETLGILRRERRAIEFWPDSGMGSFEILLRDYLYALLRHHVEQQSLFWNANTGPGFLQAVYQDEEGIQVTIDLGRGGRLKAMLDIDTTEARGREGVLFRLVECREKSQEGSGGC
jgi:hypothetical protein